MQINKESIIKLKDNKYARIAIAAICMIFLYKFYVWTRTESTDNAYVESDISSVSSQVNGVIADVLCKENQIIKIGDVLAVIDDIEYKAAFLKAISAFDAASQGVMATQQKIEIEKINIEKLSDNLRFTEENYSILLRDYNRTSKLASDNFSSKKLLDTSKIGSEKAKLELAQAKYGLESAIKNLQLLEMQKVIDEFNLQALQQNKIIAENALNNTQIKSDIDGTVTNIGMKVGNFVKTGQTIASIVPQDKLYIKANFKETQVGHLSVGMRVWIECDALPGYKMKGWIRSFSPATGSKFSLIPPDNATGNFTKVVQRIPVIIDFKPPQDIASKVKTGMSVSIKARF